MNELISKLNGNLTFNQMQNTFFNTVVDAKNYGCSPDNTRLEKLFCGNSDVATRFTCDNLGSKICSNCKIIAYCSRQCQLDHWKVHKEFCKSEVGSKDWKPNYEKEFRKPSFVDDNISELPFHNGIVEYLWGNTPAIDILNEKNNDDVSRELLFAASGDLRNIIKTVIGFQGNRLKIVCNDRNSRIVIRNIVMIYLLAKDGKNAIDAVIQLWYSSVFTHLQRVQSKIALGEIAKSSDFQFGKTNIRTNLSPKSYFEIKDIFENYMTLDESTISRNSVASHPSRIDFRHRYMSILNSGQRLSYDYYMDFGVFMPFGSLNAHLNMPNVFLFHPRFGWSQMDSASPLAGWDLHELNEFSKSKKLPVDDTYGCLFYFISDMLEKFVEKLQTTEIDFEFYDIDAIELSKKLSKSGASFDRIDVSNITDDAYVGTPAVLKNFGPLLNTKTEGSAIVALYINWLRSVPMQFIKNELGNLLKKYGHGMFDVYRIAEMASGIASQKYNAKSDFKTFMKDKDRYAAELGLKRREINRIVPKRFGGGMQDEVLNFSAEVENFWLISGHLMTERYTEWEIIKK